MELLLYNSTVYNINETPLQLPLERPEKTHVPAGLLGLIFLDHLAKALASALK
jgi:hypothetical protein